VKPFRALRPYEGEAPCSTADAFLMQAPEVRGARVAGQPRRPTQEAGIANIGGAGQPTPEGNTGHAPRRGGHHGGSGFRGDRDRARLGIDTWPGESRMSDMMAVQSSRDRRRRRDDVTNWMAEPGRRNVRVLSGGGADIHERRPTAALHGRAGSQTSTGIVAGADDRAR